MVKTVTAIKARQNLGRLLEEVYYKGGQYVIERAGRPMAAVVPVWQVQEWQKRRDRFFEQIDAVWRKQDNVKPEVLDREVETAVRAVRAKARGKRP